MKMSFFGDHKYELIIGCIILIILLFTFGALGHGGMESSPGESSTEGIIILLLIIAVIFILSHMIKKLKTLPQRSLSIIIFLLIWEIAVKTGLTYPAPIPPVSRVIHDFISIIFLEKFWDYTMVSLQRVVSGYALAMIIAIPLGFAVGWFKTLELYIDPLLQILRQTPVLSLFPVFIIFFGIGEFPKILLIMLAAIWWILLNTISAVKNVDPFLVKTARSVGVSQLDVLRKVVLPSAAPSIITGMRYASTEVVLVLVAVEMLGAKKGLGILLNFRYWEVLVFMAILGVIANYTLVALERRLSVWKEEIEIG
ncbi:MAG: ABC transporter permease [Candidatus Methanoperedenaceae archaeon]|nr:MAG: ABC transporter permease [Candidatus Methanoperedenaceae archaeon]